MKSNLFEAWRRRLRWWMIPLVVCVINGFGVLFYQLRLAGNVEQFQGRVENTTKAQADLEAQRLKAETFLSGAKTREESQYTLYREHFATSDERFTEVLREVKNLVAKAGLDPKAFSYPKAPLLGELEQLNIVFSVQGNYSQLRSFINFVELSEQFLVLEQISLNQSFDQKGKNSLSIQIRLSTIFASKGYLG